ncbi:Zinc transporter, variant 2 [Basidiobolus ranarum]|uniref:Zinc transporter, variant 2 n=1 Tax=Basidiobolus ranarum TaxID=34480 RepID=A0ABR2VZG7_9FUNG
MTLYYANFWSQENDTSSAETWILVLGSSLACLLGASIVFLDGIAHRVFKSDFRITESRTFLASSLGLASGIMMYSSLVVLLPESRHFLVESNLVGNYVDVALMCVFASGTILAFLLNRLIQWISPHDICPCHPPSLDELDEETTVGMPSTAVDIKTPHEHETSRLLPSHEPVSNPSYGSHHNHCHSYTPDVTCPDPHPSHSRVVVDDHLHHENDHHHHEQTPNEGHVHHHHHHHHDNQEEQKQCETLHRRTSVHCHDNVCMADVAAVETETKEKMQLLTVGIQTAVAISIHKFPGMLIFMDVLFCYID